MHLSLGQGLGATLEELAGPDAELWELGVIVTEPGAAAWTDFFLQFFLHPKYQHVINGPPKMT